MKNTRNRLLAIAMLLLANSAIAAPFNAIIYDGYITRIWWGPNSISFEAHDANDKPLIGTCGSGYFLIKRTDPTFKEWYSAGLVAMNAHNIMNMWVTDCVGNNNLVTGGSIIRP
jgi:hypothetical protein